MQTAAANVAHAQERLEKELPLNCEVPVEGFRILEITALSSDRERQTIRGSSTRVIHVAKRHVGGRLERRVAAQEDGIAYAEAGVESATTGSDNGLIVQLVCDPDAR